MMKLDFKNMYAWPLSYRAVVLAIVFAITIYLGYHFDIAALKKQLTTETEKEADLRQQVELAISKEATLKAEISQFTKLESLLAAWKKQLINYADIPEILNDILKMGNDNHLYFVLFNPGGEIKSGDYFIVPIKMVVVGNYHQIATFISQIANMPFMAVIGDFVLSGENKNDEIGEKLAAQASAQNLLTAAISVDLYRRPEKKDLENKDPQNKEPENKDNAAH